MPNLAGEGAGGEQVVHVLSGLVAQHATVIVRQPSPGKAVGRPTLVLQGKPDEDLDAQGCPGFPGEAPGGLDSRADEHGFVTRFGGETPLGVQRQVRASGEAESVT